MSVEVVDIPQNTKGMWGRFGAVLDEVERLPEKKCVRIAERLSAAEIDSMRLGARTRGYRLHVRTSPDATFVWKKEAKQ